MSPTPSKIHLHIEQLSLPGYSPAERRAFIAALERELAGRLAVPANAAPAARETLRLNAPDLRPESVARQAVSVLAPSGRRNGGPR